MTAYNKKLSVNKLEEASKTTDRNCILTTTTGHEPSQHRAVSGHFLLFLHFHSLCLFLKKSECEWSSVSLG